MVKLPKSDFQMKIDSILIPILQIEISRVISEELSKEVQKYWTIRCSEILQDLGSFYVRKQAKHIVVLTSREIDMLR